MNRPDEVAPVEPCIYCGSTTPRTSRDHVMPQALGTFDQNWTLDCVCDACNHYFSRELELPLGRDSAEAFIRVESGLRPPSAADKFLNRRMKGTLSEPGHIEGARVVMKSTEDGIVPVPPPQVGFRHPGDDWNYVLERELCAEALGQVEGRTVEVKVIGKGDDLLRLKQRLAEIGIDFTETHRLLDQPITEGTSVTVEHQFIVDGTLRRAASKIAFNYAARVLGAAVMRRSDFDAVRRFVRLGEEAEPIATANRFSILVGAEAETTMTHVCGLGWLAPRRELIAVVSLFNTVTYGIRMCHSGSDEWASVTSRHLFDPFKRTIIELAAAS